MYSIIFTLSLKKNNEVTKWQKVQMFSTSYYGRIDAISLLDLILKFLIQLVLTNSRNSTQFTGNQNKKYRDKMYNTL